MQVNFLNRLPSVKASSEVWTRMDAAKESLNIGENLILPSCKDAVSNINENKVPLNLKFILSLIKQLRKEFKMSFDILYQVLSKFKIHMKNIHSEGYLWNCKTFFNLALNHF